MSPAPMSVTAGMVAPLTCTEGLWAAAATEADSSEAASSAATRRRTAIA
jgi:hypothetical protein